MKAVISHQIVKVNISSPDIEATDEIIVEEPLEIFLQSGDQNRSKEAFIVAMRTPGEDRELTIGILYAHGLIQHRNEVRAFKFIVADEERTQVQVSLSNIKEHVQKRAYTNASCGVCNFASLDDVMLHSNYPVLDPNFRIKSQTIIDSMTDLSARDDHFSKTGGNHKICIIDNAGIKISFAEDVGRHNAFDKIIGKALLSKALPLSNTAALLSGRTSFEMCQKAWMAGIPVVASIGAPTSKAIEMAENAGITLLGFVKQEGFNIYTHPERVDRNA